MSFQPGANVYTQGFGSRPENVEVPHIDVRNPSPTDVLYPLGKWWLNVGNSVWYLISQSSSLGQTSSNWIQIGGSSGNIISINGTANEITVSTTAGVATLSIPPSFIAPGSIASTTTLTAGAGLTVTTGNLTLSDTASKIFINASVPSKSSVGTSAAMSGSGTVTVMSLAVTTSSIILFSRKASGGTVGEVHISAQSTGSFTLTSSSISDTSTFNYIIIN